MWGCWDLTKNDFLRTTLAGVNNVIASYGSSQEEVQRKINNSTEPERYEPRQLYPEFDERCLEYLHDDLIHTKKEATA
jgi:hypothetical protein